MDLGSVRWRVEVDTTDLSRANQAMEGTRGAATGAADATGKLGATAERTGRKGRRATQAFGAELGNLRRMAGFAARALAVVGVGAGVAQGIRTIVDFQQELSGLRAVTMATTEDMQRLENQARLLGATTAFGANQAAQAQRFLAQAGLEVNRVIGATPQVLQLAQAGMLELGEAADLATDIMAAMGLQVDDITRINDNLVATANSATTNVRQLGEAFSFAGEPAARFGLSLEETSAALGIISSAGIKASRAGTGLAGIFAQIRTVSEDVEAALLASGVAVSDLDIETRGFIPVLRTLADANLRAADLQELFGQRASGAAGALIAALPEYEKQVETLTEINGVAETAAKTLTDNLGGAFKGLGSAIQEANLQLGDGGLSGALSGVVMAATGVIQVFNGLENEWAEANDVGATMVGTVRALASAITVVTAAIVGRGVQALTSYTAAKVAATGATVTFTGVLRALRTVMATLFGPVGLAFAGAALLFELGTAFGDATDTAAEFDAAVSSAADSLQGFTEGALVMQIAAVSVELERARGAAESLDAITRTRNFGGMAGPGAEMSQTEFERVADAGNQASDAVNGLETQLAGLETALSRVRDAGSAAANEGIDEPGSAAASASGEVDKLRDDLDRLVARYDSVAAATMALAETEDVLTRSVAAGYITRERANKVNELASRILQDQLDPMGALMTELEREGNLVRMSADAREVSNRMRTIEQDLLRSGIVLEGEQREAIQATIEANREANALSERKVQILQELRGPQAEFESGLAAINSLLAEGSITQAEYNSQLEQMERKLFEATNPLSELEKEMKSHAETAAQSVQGAFADFLFDPFDKGIKGLVDGFTKAMQRMVAEMLAAQVMQSIFSGASGFAGMFGGGGGAGMFASFDGGGFTGSAPRSGGIDGKGGFMAMLHPNETVIDHSRGGGGTMPAQQITNNFTLQQKEDRRTQKQLALRAAESQRRAAARFGA